MGIEVKPRARPLIGLTALIVAGLATLSRCAQAACPAVKIDDNFSIVARSTSHRHPLLSLCESKMCTPPVNASSQDRGASVRSTPPLALYTTSIDRWSVSVLDDTDGQPSADPRSVSVKVYNGTTLLTTRTITPSWHHAPGRCSAHNTANTIRIALP